MLNKCADTTKSLRESEPNVGPRTSHQAPFSSAPWGPKRPGGAPGATLVGKQEESVEIGRKTGPHSPLISKCSSPVLDNGEKGAIAFTFFKKEKSKQVVHLPCPRILVLEMGKLSSSGERS